VLFIQSPTQTKL